MFDPPHLLKKDHNGNVKIDVFQKIAMDKIPKIIRAQDRLRADMISYEKELIEWKESLEKIKRESDEYMISLRQQCNDMLCKFKPISEAEAKKIMEKIILAQDVQHEEIKTMPGDVITGNPESEEVAEIRTEQNSQMEAMKVKHEAERREDRIWDDMTNNFNKRSCWKDKGQERELGEKQKHLLEQKVALSREHEQHHEYLDKVVYSSKGPTNEF